MTTIDKPLCVNSQDEALTLIGSALRRRRLANNWTQGEIAKKLDMGLSTYRKMESNDPGVAIVHWCKAWNFYDVMSEVHMALVGTLDLFDMMDEKLGVTKKKQRASSK